MASRLGDQRWQLRALHPSALQRASHLFPNTLPTKILAERHTLEGERKQVTILFADIKDSTRLVEGRDPEEAQKVLDPILKSHDGCGASL